MSARVFAVQDRQLSTATVARLAADLRTAEGLQPLVVDLSAVVTLAPEGLAALIELGRSQTGVREVILAGLSRALTLAAVQAGLAERYNIFCDVEASLRALESRT